MTKARPASRNHGEDEEATETPTPRRGPAPSHLELGTGKVLAARGRRAPGYPFATRAGPVPCLEDADRFLCAKLAVRVADGIGFSGSACVAIGMSAAELAASAARHGGGELVVQALFEASGIEIVCWDRDHPAHVGRPGCELGAIVRAMDELSVTPRPAGGRVVIARRYLRAR